MCGEAVGPAPEPCPFCDTPHHFDCWEYNQGCGVYACPSKTRKPRARPEPDENSVDRPGKLGMPHKKAGNYAGVWWVPPMAGAMSVGFEFLAIAMFGAGAPFMGLASLGAMGLCLAWIAFSSVRYYVDFETLRITKAKALRGADLVEWEVCPLDQVERLEVQASYRSSAPGAAPDVPRYRVVAVPKAMGAAAIELAPPMPYGSPELQEVADLFRRIEASGAFPTAFDRNVRALPPPGTPATPALPARAGGEPDAEGVQFLAVSTFPRDDGTR